MKATRILGIDPGSRLTGYGCIDILGNTLHPIEHGTLKLLEPNKDASFDERILNIYLGLKTVIERLRPEVLAIEKVFFAKNAVSALKLGQARGAVILTGKIFNLTIVEYSATEIKQSITGYGRADKNQIAKILNLILGSQKFSTSDASDALAIALCHAYRMKSVAREGLKDIFPKPSRKRSTLSQALSHKIKNKGFD